MSEKFTNERQERVDQLVQEGHSLAHSTGAAWAEQNPDFTAPPEPGVDAPGTISPGVGPA